MISCTVGSKANALIMHKDRKPCCIPMYFYFTIKDAFSDITMLLCLLLCWWLSPWWAHPGDIGNVVRRVGGQRKSPCSFAHRGTAGQAFQKDDSTSQASEAKPVDRTPVLCPFLPAGRESIIDPEEGWTVVSNHKPLPSNCLPFTFKDTNRAVHL